MRRLVVCCDGTWKTADDKATTNVVKMMDAIVPVVRDAGGREETHQISWYGKGVGTGDLLDRLWGGAFGEGLGRNVRDAYRFLVQNYAPGDEIYLFGFSRGAYTARSVAGIIRCAGLVQKKFADRITEAYDIYRLPDPKGPDKDTAVEFRKKYAHPDVRIKCIGVWDTVGALGVPIGRVLRMLSRHKHGFHDTRLSSIIENAFHALAIDEGRYTFEPSLFKDDPDDKQRVEQVWFAGAHSDVGGGYPDPGLSDIALQWMAQKAASCGLVLSVDYLSDRTKINPKPENAPNDSRYIKFLPGNIRDIGRTPAEDVHESARGKVADAKYEAPNLREYLARPAKLVSVLPAPKWITAEGKAVDPPPPVARPVVVKLLRSFFGSNAAARMP